MAANTNRSSVRGVFVTTRWSLVRHAANPGSSQTREALETLCQTYWPPLYAFARRQGHAPHDAQDLTQEFFARFLAREDLADADPALGRFRSFLLGAFKHFLSNARDRAQARKRGGHQAHLALDTAEVEHRVGIDPGHYESPDRIYEREWALALLNEVLGHLRDEQAQLGNLEGFEILKITLTAGKGAVPYAELANRLGSTEGAVKVAAHRLRKRYRELLRTEIRQTVDSDAEVDDELRHLMSSLAGV